MGRLADRSRTVFEFGNFRFTARDRLLMRNGASVPLRPRAADVLLALLERHGEVLSKHELLDAVWLDTAVGESALTFQINQVRGALGDSASDERYIETLPKRGYRFVAPIRETVAPEAVTASEAAPGVSVSHRFRWRWLLWTGAAGVTLVLAAVLLRRGAAHEEPWTPPRIVRSTLLSTNPSRSAYGTPLLTDGRRIYFDTTGRLTAMDIATGRLEPIPALAGFHVHDVSTTGREFLAVRLADPGADHGLWIVPAAGAPRRLSDLRTTGGAAWSPGGDRVAFALDRDLFVADRDGANVRRVASANGDVSGVRWSPDATRLRFDVSVSADRRARGAIWEAGVDGGAPRLLFGGTAATPDACCGAWTPEGSHFVFQVGSFEDGAIWIASGGLAGAADSTPRPLTKGPMSFAGPVVSTDGRRIFALGRRTDGELARFDERSAAFTPYLGGLSALWVTYSRDGVWMAYESFPDRALWRARADGRDKQRLTSSPLRVDGSAISPDGQWIVFRGRDNENARLKNYLVPAAGGTPQPLVPDDVEQGLASWSPDGQQLVYGDVPERFGLPTGSEAIHVYDRRTRTAGELPDSRGLWSSRWSPDGRYVAALTIRGQQLRLFDVVSRRWLELPIDHVNNATWTRDSRWLYFDTEGREPHRMRRVRVPGRAAEEVFDFSNLPRAAYWWTGLSIDDRPIVLRTPGGSQIYALYLDQP
jgi:DNA-binding winged helix-turn-helix (wHTH) protein/Tol biopolymer transport system component